MVDQNITKSIWISCAYIHIYMFVNTKDIAQSLKENMKCINMYQTVCNMSCVHQHEGVSGVYFPHYIYIWVIHGT